MKSRFEKFPARASNSDREGSMPFDDAVAEIVRSKWWAGPRPNPKARRRCS